MKPLVIVRCAICAILWCAGSVAIADPLYQFTFDQPNYTVAPGDTVNVTVFLEETPGTAFRCWTPTA